MISVETNDLNKGFPILVISRRTHQAGPSQGLKIRGGLYLVLGGENVLPLVEIELKVS